MINQIYRSISVLEGASTLAFASASTSTTMEAEVAGCIAAAAAAKKKPTGGGGDELRLKKETLQALLDQCHQALQSLQHQYQNHHHDDESSSSSDSETNELCGLLKSRIDSPNFLEKLGSVHASVSQKGPAEECNSWDMVSEKDVWGGGDIDDALESEQEGYVLVKQEDIVEGIACFMAAYLLSLKETKELSPNQLQEALSKTFSVRKRKGKLRKAWDGSKVVYNVASWGATAIGIYQNPALLRAASMAFWNSCHVISKLL